MQQHQHYDEQHFISKFLRSERLAVSVVFAAALFVFEYFSFPAYYRSFYLPEIFQSGLYVAAFKILVTSAASFLLTIFFVASALFSPYRYRAIYFSLFCLSAFVEYGYQNAFDRFTNLEDVVNAFVASDARMMSGYVTIFYNTAAAVPCLAFGALLLLIKPQLKTGLKMFLVFLFSFSVFYSLTAYCTTNVFPSASVTSLYRTALALPVNWYFGSAHQPAYANLYHVPRREVGFRAVAAPGNNVVFIVDESVRGDHLSLNGYARATTPFLEELNRKGLIKNWGIGVSGTTCSINSNNLLLTGVNRVPDTEGEIFLAPTVFQYARAAGYKTFYFDGQMTYRWLGKSADTATFGEWITAADLKKGEWHEVDAEIARRVREIVGSSTGNFIWINKFGVHSPYFASYPSEESKWLPTPRIKTDSAEAGDKAETNQFEEIKNNYDNAILYNSESFFKTLLGEGLPENTFFVYTSDHGQNLGEDGRLISHCAETANEAGVPLFMIADPEKLPANLDTRYPAAHANLFPTLLDLMNIPDGEKTRGKNYSLSLFKARAADARPRFYFTGSLHNATSGRRYLFDK